MSDTNSSIVSLAMLPARLVARMRPSLARSNVLDAQRFSGRATLPFLVLIAIAIVYPIAASAAHMLGDTTPGGESLALALRPAFDTVYAESLPFMLTALALGLLSPAVGVLFVAVFVPADLIAASRNPPELTNMYNQVPFTAWIAHLASYVLFWILVVEIPLAVRTWAIARATRDGRAPVQGRLVVLSVLGTVALVSVWTSSIGLLIRPVFTWSVLQTPSRWSSDPTWYYGWILVLGAGIAAAAAAFWPRRLAGSLEETAADMPPAAAGSATVPLWRQLVFSVVLFFVLGGLITSVAEAIVIGLGLLVAGPGLSILGPSLPALGRLAGASRQRRAAIGIVVVVVLAAAAMVLAGKALFGSGYLVFDLVVVGGIIVFRFVLDGGRRPRQPGVDVSTVGVTAASLLLTIVLPLVVWLAVPALALADDCSDWSVGEVGSCPSFALDRTLGFLAGAAAAAGAMASGRPKPKSDGDDDDPTKTKPIKRPPPITPPPNPWQKKPPPPARPDGPLGPKKAPPPNQPDNFKWYWPPSWF